MKKLFSLALLGFLSVSSVCLADYKPSAKFKNLTDNEIKVTEIDRTKVNVLKHHIGKVDRGLFLNIQNTSKDTTYLMANMLPMVLLKDKDGNNIAFKDSKGRADIILELETNDELEILQPGESENIYFIPVRDEVNLQNDDIYSMRISIEFKKAVYDYEKGNIEVGKDGPILELFNLH